MFITNNLNIGVIGLGLIGGSFCKAIKACTGHSCRGFDLNPDIPRAAKETGAIDEILDLNDCGALSRLDLVIVCLHPKQTIEFISDNAARFSENSLVIDSCGVKGAVMSAVLPALNAENVPFIGAHPMAGREFSGFDYSLPDLFKGASFIITPPDNAKERHIRLLSDLAYSLGFGRVVSTTAQKHDETIAFTSQIAHILSNAYVKSPTLQNQSGFSAGSFQDLSRVAKLNEDMWTDLFLMNNSALLFELETLIGHLSEYRSAIKNEDADGLKSLLRDGRILKENSM